MSVLSRLFPAKQKQESPAPRRHHHLNTSPYRIIIVPDAVVPIIERVTSSGTGRLINLIAHHSVNLEDMRGMEDSEFFLLWDADAYLPPYAAPDAAPMRWLIAQVNVYTREIKDISEPNIFESKFGHYQNFRSPNWMEFSLAKRLAGVDDAVAVYEDEYSECGEDVDEATAAVQDSLLSHVRDGGKPANAVAFDLYCIDAMTDEITVTCLGKVTAADWHDHVDEMLALARPLARNTRSAHLYALLGKKRQALLAEFDVSGGQA